MSAGRKATEFNIEYPLYSGLYKSLIQYIDIGDIISPEKPAISAAAVSSFSKSLTENGFLRPVYLSQSGAVSDGRKRYAAARALGAKRIPCVVSPTPLVFEDDLLILKLRAERVSFFESADVLSVLTSSYLYSQEEVAAALGRSQSYVANRLRLLAFSEEERNLIEGYSLTERHCRALLKIKDPSERIGAIAAVGEKSMTVGDAEAFVSSVCSSKRMPEEARLRRELDSLLGSYSEKVDLAASSTVGPDGSVVFTIKIRR